MNPISRRNGGQERFDEAFWKQRRALRRSGETPTMCTSTSSAARKNEREGHPRVLSEYLPHSAVAKRKTWEESKSAEDRRRNSEVNGERHAHIRRTREIERRRSSGRSGCVKYLNYGRWWIHHSPSTMDLYFTVHSRTRRALRRYAAICRRGLNLAIGKAETSTSSAIHEAF